MADRSIKLQRAPQASEAIDLALELARAQSGDRNGAARLIEATQGRLYRFCLFLSRNPYLAQDLCQDTYVRLIENLQTITHAGTLQGWLFKTAQRLYFDFLKRSVNRGHLDLESVPESVAGLVDAGALDHVVQVHRALGDLKPEERVVLLLVDREGYSYAEAAILLGIKEDALRSRLHRARAAFAKRFERR
jgi:RNA polymerase sigma-70 factor (ECF subfamily)